MRKILIVVGVLLIAGCAKPTIDASSYEALQASMKEVRQSLPENKRSEFDRAVAQLTMNGFGDVMKAAFSGEAVDADGIVRMSLNGKTGEEVIAAAAALTAQREAKQREQALEEIRELRAKQASAEQARVELTNFQVLRSRFYQRKERYGRPQPVIELRVKNGTAHPVSRAYFVGTAATPGRAIPWIKEDFNFEIAGGLEPGEEKAWTLEPNMFSDWGRAEVPADAVFTVEVVKLDGADGEVLFSARAFDERDQRRLKSLLEKYSAE